MKNGDMQEKILNKIKILEGRILTQEEASNLRKEARELFDILQEQEVQKEKMDRIISTGITKCLDKIEIVELCLRLRKKLIICMSEMCIAGVCWLISVRWEDVFFSTVSFVVSMVMLMMVVVSMIDIFKEVDSL